MTRQVGFWRGLLLLGLAVACGSNGACDQRKRAPGVAQTWDNVCVDMDGDGFGFQCRTGDDCDDANEMVHEGCSDCRTAQAGCACDTEAEPRDCRLPYSVDKSGALLCHTGTRYCRDGVWSECEGVVSFSVPPPVHTLGTRSLVDPTAQPVRCDVCNPDCYRIEDRVDTPFGVDAGIGTNVVSNLTGGVTLMTESSSGTLPPPFTGLLDEAPCIMEDMSDCDGLPSPFDVDPTRGPAGATHKTMLVDVPAGASAAPQRFQTKVEVRALDVYLYADATSNSGDVLNSLHNSFETGNHLPSGGAGINCVDADGDGMPDDANKTGGIAGNIACLVRDARFGAGWFREIPFYGPQPGINRLIAPWDTEMFAHAHDLSTDRAAVHAALGMFQPRANLNTPEGGMQGLWAVATGGALYAGWDRPGVPARSGCPAGTFGYPCFRDEALPVVLMFTDAPMESGPSTAARSFTTPPTPANCLADAVEFAGNTYCDPLHYDPSVLNVLKAGSESMYRTLSVSAEDLATAQPIGTVDNALITYVGSTFSLRSDFTSASNLGCAPWNGSDEAAPDAAFRFHVDTPGRYLISGRGTHFDATLVVVHADAGGAPSGLVGCSDDDVILSQLQERNLAPELEANLTAGDYIVVLKGYGALDKGWFQLSVGMRSLQTSGVFDAKRWLGPGDMGPGGVREALQDKGIRVITVQSGNDTYAHEQALALASATKAVAAGVPLRGSILPDGTYLGRETVRVVRDLLQNVEFDVSLDLANTGVNPNPGFVLTVEALDQPGNGCHGVADTSRDTDTIPDTHLDCAAGATPQFRVTYANPAGAGAVPLNAADPAGQGGYFMWMRVLGDNHIVLDRVPVYAIPADVRLDPTIRYRPNGNYDQEIRANACAENEGPIWGRLTWSADLPPGTRMTFEACAAESADMLSGCTFHQAFTLSPGATCANDEACNGLGYCAPSGTCQLISGIDCMEDVECGAYGSTCGGISGSGSCTNTRAVLDLRPIAQMDMQGRRYARMRVQLFANDDRTQAPTLLQWSLDYTCGPRN